MKHQALFLGLGLVGLLGAGASAGERTRTDRAGPARGQAAQAGTGAGVVAVAQEKVLPDGTVVLRFPSGRVMPKPAARAGEDGVARIRPDGIVILENGRALPPGSSAASSATRPDTGRQPTLQEMFEDHLKRVPYREVDLGDGRRRIVFSDARVFPGLMMRWSPEALGKPRVVRDGYAIYDNGRVADLRSLGRDAAGPAPTSVIRTRGGEQK